MTIRTLRSRGARRLLIDIRFKKKDGSKDRYRRVSSAASIAAARDEERVIRDRIARTGSPYEAPVTAPPELEFEHVVQEYRKQFMPAHLKPSTRRGYNSVIDKHLLPALGGNLLNEISAQSAYDLDSKLGQEPGRKKAGKAKSTRNNVQIVLRSILRFARQRGYLGAPVPNLPALKRTGQLVDQIPTDDEINRLLEKACATQRRFFLLMAYGGLRPNEVRALLGRDIRWESINGQRRGTLLVREGLSAGELGEPKTGQRKVPILGPLVEELHKPPSANDPVATTAASKPWGEWTPNQAFKRLCDRLKLPDGYTIYSLRHWAITSWLRAGIPVHVVQRMAGHKHLSTTQRYVHFIDADLDAAATIWGSYGATAAE